MQKKYEFVAHDWVFAGTRRRFRIRTVRDFGELGGVISAETSSRRRTSVMRAIAWCMTWLKCTGLGL